MHRPFDVAQRRASRTNARHRRVRGAAGQIEKNLTHSKLAVLRMTVISAVQEVQPAACLLLASEDVEQHFTRDGTERGDDVSLAYRLGQRFCTRRGVGDG